MSKGYLAQSQRVKEDFLEVLIPLERKKEVERRGKNKRD